MLTGDDNGGGGGGWRRFQAQLLQCWVGEAIADVVERFGAVASTNSRSSGDDSSSRGSVALLSLLHSEQRQHAEDGDAAAFANISALAQQFLKIRHEQRPSGANGDTVRRYIAGDELLVAGGVSDANGFSTWLQMHHQQQLAQQGPPSSCLIVLYAPLLPDEVQDEIKQVVITPSQDGDAHRLRTLLLLIHNPVGLMDVLTSDDSAASQCYSFVDSQTAIAMNDDPSTSLLSSAPQDRFEQYLTRPLKQLGTQCGLRFVMEIARWAVFSEELGAGSDAITTDHQQPRTQLQDPPPPMLAIASQMPFQLLLLALRWSHFHPALTRAFAQPFERKLRLIPQQRVRDAIFQLRTQQLGLWSHLYDSDDNVLDPKLFAPSRRHQTEPSAITQLPLGNCGGDDSHLRSLSRCYLWDVQKQFYISQGIKAWSDGIIPFGVSSSSFLAAAYARVAHEFFLEATASGLHSGNADAPNCFVWEAASGSCKFLHSFLVHFYALIDSVMRADPHRDGLRPCVVASDLSDQVLASRMKMACFQPFLSAKRLEFARFDTAAFTSGDSEKQLLLKHSQRVWRVGSDGPVFLVGNYFLDSLRTDVFAVTRSAPASEGQSAAATHQLRVYEGRIDPKISSIADMELAFKRIDTIDTEPVYNDPFVNQVFLDVLESIRNSSTSPHPAARQQQQPSSLILFPVEAMQFFRTLVSPVIDQHANRQYPVGILIGDAGFSFRDPISSAFINREATEGGGDALFEIPQLSPHPDCFCLPVDFEILRLLFQRIANEETSGSSSSQLASAVATDTFDVLYARVCPSPSPNAQSPSPSSASASQVAFAHEFASFTPSDCDLLWGMMAADDDSAARFSLKTQLALLAQSAWDFDLFVVLQWTLLQLWRDASRLQSSDDLRLQLVAVGMKCWQTHYVLIDGDDDGDEDGVERIAHSRSLLQISRWLYALDAHAEIVALLSGSIKSEPQLERNVSICYILALALYYSKDFWQALVFFRKCFAIAPLRLKFRRRIAQTLLALQKQKQKQKTHIAAASANASMDAIS